MNLLEFLRTHPNTRKVFGKRELIIIDKQLNGINLTQSEKNRLSRDIRPKLRFIKGCSKFDDEFELKKGSMIESIIKEAKEVILESKFFSKIKKIILFGSTIEKQRTSRSDIDIAVVFYKTNLKEATYFRAHVSGRTNKRVDIQVYNTLPNKLKKDIDKKGKVIYKK